MRLKFFYFFIITIFIISSFCSCSNVNKNAENSKSIITNISSSISFANSEISTNNDESNNTSSKEIVEEYLMNPISLNSFNDMTDWINGKNDFTDRHKSTKNDLIKENKFFNDGYYFKLKDIKNYHLNKIEFFGEDYAETYESDSKNNKLYGTDNIGSLSCVVVISYTKKISETVYSIFSKQIEDSETVNTSVKYTKTKQNGINYLIQISNKYPSEGPMICWMQDDYLITAFFYNRQYNEDILNSCFIEKVYT